MKTRVVTLVDGKYSVNAGRLPDGRVTIDFVQSRGKIGKNGEPSVRLVFPDDSTIVGLSEALDVVQNELDNSSELDFIIDDFVDGVMTLGTFNNKTADEIRTAIAAALTKK